MLKSLPKSALGSGSCGTVGCISAWLGILKYIQGFIKSLQIVYFGFNLKTGWEWKFVKYEDNVMIWNSVEEISNIKNNLYVYGYR